MERFLQRHRDRHVGSIAGIDRLWFRGILRSICYVEGLNYFMGNQRVPFKGFKAFVEKFSAGVKARAERIAKRAGRAFLYVSSGQADKEKLVREVRQRNPVQEGLVCVLSCVEPCQSFTPPAGAGEATTAVGGVRAQVPASLLLPPESGLWVDAHSPADLVAADHPGVREWARMAGTADEACRDGVRKEGQLLHFAPSGTSLDGPIRGLPLGEVAEPLGPMGESLAGCSSPSSTARLLLEGASRRMRHGRDLP